MNTEWVHLCLYLSEWLSFATQKALGITSTMLKIFVLTSIKAENFMTLKHENFP